MTVYYPEAFETLKIRSPDVGFDTVDSAVLIRADELEVVRLVLGAGHELRADGSASGLITMQCLEGAAELTSGSLKRTLAVGDLLFLPATATHSIRGIENAILLVTGVRCPICYET